MKSARPAGAKTKLMRRVLRRLGLVLAIFLLIAFLVPVGLGWLSFWAVTHPPCGVGPAPDQYNLQAEDISIPSRIGVEFRGYFFPGTNGATIIVPPAYGQNRTGLLHEVHILVRRGFNVLTYDSRPCTGIAPHSLGIWEADDILDALAYLETRDNIDLSRIGLHGFSQAGASNLFAAARSTAFKAVVAEGGYVDYGLQTLSIGQSSDPFTVLFGLGAQFAYRIVTGFQMSQLKLLEVIPDIAPVRVLLVYGTHELTLAGARQAAEAGDHVSLWEVPGATHGAYVAAVGEAEFGRYVAGFFEEVLLSDG